MGGAWPWSPPSQCHAPAWRMAAVWWSPTMAPLLPALGMGARGAGPAPGGGSLEGAKCQSSGWAWLCFPWSPRRRRGHLMWGHGYPVFRSGCGVMPGQEDALAAGCLGMAAPEHPGVVQGLAPGGTMGMVALSRHRRVMHDAGWAGAGRRACGQLNVLRYSAAPQVGGPGAAEPALPEGDRARLVRQGERRGRVPRDTPALQDGVRGSDGRDKPVPHLRYSWAR